MIKDVKFTMKSMKNRISFQFILLAGMLSGLSGCSNLKEAGDVTTPAPIVVERGRIAEGKTDKEATDADIARAGEGTADGAQMAEPELQTSKLEMEPAAQRVPVNVKGVYISSYVAGTPDMMDRLIMEIDRTEANALIIDLKDDFGRVACEMDSPLIQEIGSIKTYIPDIEGLMKKLKEHDIYVIARIPAFRDAWLGEARPDWCIHKADGSIFKDRDGNAWVNPYKREAWDYLVEIAIQAGKLGFDEVQFDYVRFCTEKGMKEAVFDEADVQGRSRTDIICEFMEYAYEILKNEGVFVSADVFGAIINSDVNADSVGQIYGEMAKYLDYISPMIYPSHYADGNYGIDHPDIHPYETIRAALEDSRKELYFAAKESEHIAQVRPWLQDFTATWLANHIEYGPEQIRQQIQATYDSGYDEWMLWDASCRYCWDGLLTPEEAEMETKRIEESRAALPETTYAAEPDRVAETGSALEEENVQEGDDADGANCAAGRILSSF